MHLQPRLWNYAPDVAHSPGFLIKTLQILNIGILTKTWVKLMFHNNLNRIAVSGTHNDSNIYRQTFSETNVWVLMTSIENSTYIFYDYNTSSILHSIGEKVKNYNPHDSTASRVPETMCEGLFCCVFSMLADNLNQRPFRFTWLGATPMPSAATLTNQLWLAYCIFIQLKNDAAAFRQQSLFHVSLLFR